MKHLILLILCALWVQNLTAQPLKIAVLGCHQQGRPAPALAYIANEMQPDYCIWVGDNVYADTEDDPQHIRRELEVLAAKEGFSTLRENSQFLVTWDDHDFGLNNAGKDYKFREESKQIHRTFWQLENEIPKDHDGVYYAKIETMPNGKKVQFIMVDGRYNRDKPGANADALGAPQWKWLEEQLNKEADLRFLVSGYQVLINKPTRWEAWAKLGDSRKRLFNLIKSTGAKGVVFITGDQHYVEVIRKNKLIGYDAVEFMASGINQTERAGMVGKRVAGPDRTLNSAPLMTIHWKEKDGLAPHIHFTVTNTDNKATTLDYRLFLKDIGL